jgi:uncharacterized protein YqhQ
MLKKGFRRHLLGIVLAAPQAAAYAPIGGQAVIEGVMIRSPRRVATAVRRTSGAVSVRCEPFLSVLKRSALLRLPVIRGGAGLIESMAMGINALVYSAEEAVREEAPGAGAGSPAVPGPPEPAAVASTGSDPGSPAGAASSQGALSRLAIGATLVLSLALGLFIFFYLPLVLAGLTGVRGSLAFNILDGVIRLVFLLVYLWGVGQWSEMKRLFGFHGAEHKAIHNFESGQPLSAETAAGFSRLHPRCGTAFLLTVMLTSIVVFAFFGRPTTIAERLLRLAAVPLIGGISFEFVRFSGRHWERRWVRFLAAPGIELQRLTTREPDLEQLAVAIRAVESVTPLEVDDQGEIRVM